METLTPFLQREIPRVLQPGWTAAAEVSLLPGGIAAWLGYAPRADIVITHEATGRRVWVEFEVSRADPVANHAKFATAHLFVAQTPADVFLAMLSTHIDRGRRNLAAATIQLMRRVGMRAYQTTLFPAAGPSEIKRLNGSNAAALAAAGLDLGAEVERILAVVTSLGKLADVDIHLVGDVLDLLANVRGWNDDLSAPEGPLAWGRRACTYFVYDPTAGLFAPAKFCAYSLVATGSTVSPRMTAVAYAELNDGTHLMDGGRAWLHLTREVGFRPGDFLSIADLFRGWLDRHEGRVTVRGEPVVLFPPTWYIADH